MSRSGIAIVSLILRRMEHTSGSLEIRTRRVNVSIVYEDELVDRLTHGYLPHTSENRL